MFHLCLLQNIIVCSKNYYQKAGNPNPFPNMSLESLIEIDFFSRELMNWISLQDFGRLRRLNKKINSKLNYNDQIEFLSKSNIFLRVSIKGRIDILEKILNHYSQQPKTSIPFFPRSLCLKILKETCNQGNFNVFSSLVSQKNQLFPIFENINFFSYLEDSLRNKKIEFFKACFEILDPKEQSAMPLDFVSRLSQLYDVAFRFCFENKEILLFLLERKEKATNQPTEHLKRIKQTLNNPSDLNQQHLLEWYFSLFSRSYLFFLDFPVDKFFQRFPLMESNNPQKWDQNLSIDLFALDTLINIWPLVLPEIFLSQFEKLKFSNRETIQLRDQYVIFMRNKWFAFICDIDSLKKNVSNEMDIMYSLVSSIEHGCLLSFIVKRCIDRPNPKIESALDYCLSILKVKEFKLQTAPKVFECCLDLAVRAKRGDLYEKLRSFLNSKKSFVEINSVFQKLFRDFNYDYLAQHQFSFESIETQPETGYQLIHGADLESLRFEIENQKNQRLLQTVTTNFPYYLSDAFNEFDLEKFKFYISMCSPGGNSKLTKETISFYQQKLKLVNEQRNKLLNSPEQAIELSKLDKKLIMLNLVKVILKVE